MSIKSFGVAVTVGGTAIGKLTAANISGGDTAVHDTTTHQTSTARTFTGGLSDSGSLELEGHYDESDSGQDTLRASQGGSPVAVVVTYSDSSTASFSAVVQSFNPSNPLDEIVTFSASLKISGDVTYAAGA